MNLGVKLRVKAGVMLGVKMRVNLTADLRVNSMLILITASLVPGCVGSWGLCPEESAATRRWLLRVRCRD